MPLKVQWRFLNNLKESGNYKIYALTNWSAETFPVALQRYDFLNWFDGVVVSGAEKMRKPTPAFYQLLLDRYNVKAAEALFIDDNLRNVLAAEKLGIKSIHFSSARTIKIRINRVKDFLTTKDTEVFTKGTSCRA
jgi:2-haloacid dehalogenase